MSLAGVFEHHDAFGCVVVDGEVEATLEGHRGAVRSVELRERVAALDARGISGHRYDVVGNDVFGQEVDEVVGGHKSGEAFLDDAEERVERCEVFEVGDWGLQGIASYFRAAAVLAANSVKLQVLCRSR